MSAVTLRWTVRASFLRYVAALPDGRASVSDGAVLTLDDPQAVHFPAEPQVRPGALAFAGDLRLAGHGGLLFVRVAAPRIEPSADGARATLTIADPLAEDPLSRRLALADLQLVEGPDGWRGEDVRLLAEGAGLFNGVYAVGDLLDDLVISRDTD